MITKSINVLGTEYTLNQEVLSSDNPAMNANYGFCDSSIKEINIAKFESSEPDDLKNIKVFMDKVTRHEIIHAFLEESGLSECCEWARNEEMVDFFAQQIPKMVKVFNKIEVL